MQSTDFDNAWLVQCENHRRVSWQPPQPAGSRSTLAEIHSLSRPRGRLWLIFLPEAGQLSLGQAGSSPTNCSRQHACPLEIVLSIGPLLCVWVHPECLGLQAIRLSFQIFVSLACAIIVKFHGADCRHHRQAVKQSGRRMVVITLPEIMGKNIAIHRAQPRKLLIH